MREKWEEKWKSNDVTPPNTLISLLILFNASTRAIHRRDAAPIFIKNRIDPNQLPTVEESYTHKILERYRWQIVDKNPG